ncbi:MAG: glycosyl hydrolase family 18 protein [Cytophagaceae bacterium]
MKKILLYCLVTFITFTSLNAQQIVGYLPSYRDPSTSNIQYSKVNTIIYAFINPDTEGNLITTNVGSNLYDFSMTHFLTVKNNCAQNGVKLAISIGGADVNEIRSARLNHVSSNATRRQRLIDQIVAFAIQHNLYGIDVDWEFPKTTEAKNNHEALIAGLRTKINGSANPNIKLGIAVGGEYSGSVNHLQYINNGAIQHIDDWHIMSYDFPASYNANHASLTDAQNSVTQWSQQKSIAKSKIYMGVPFYGRNSARTQESDYREFSASNPSGAYNSTTDLMNGWYYNARPTLETKTEYVVNNGYAGIMIWDLGQDRTDQYSLLSAIYTKMSSMCQAPQPNLGPDVGFCTGSVTLNSAVATATGRTFTWKRNGSNVVTNSASATTYNATQGGTYVVEVTQGGCTKTDVVEVMAGSSLSTTGAERCGSGQVTLKVNNTGGTYQWFNTSTGGSVIHTGGTYTPTVSTTTTYWVQENTGSQNYSAGRALPRTESPWAWNEGANSVNNTLPKWAHKITVHQDLTIQTVKVWVTGTVNNARLMVISTANGTQVLQQGPTANLTAAGNPHTLTGNFTLTPGSYYIGVFAPSVDGGGSTSNGIWLDHDISHPTTQSGVFEIAGTSWVSYGLGFNADPNATAHYGQLFDWVINTGVAPPCGRTQVVASVIPATSTSLSVTATPTSVCSGTNGTITVASSENDVTYRPYIGANTAGSAVTGNGSNINLTVNSGSLSTGSNTITVQATKIGCGTVNLTTQPTITVNTAPGQPAAFTTSSSSVNRGQSNVTYTVPTVSGATSYQWTYSGTGATITGTTNSVQISFSASATSGTLSVVAKNSCGDSPARTMDITVNIPTSTADISGISGFEVFPNPIDASSVVKLDLVSSAQVSIEIYNTMGMKVQTLIEDQSLSSGTYHLPLGELPSGTFIIKMKANGSERNLKVVK